MMADKQHYRSIFKSTTLIGGAALINILIGMVRTKFVAVLLGPAGVGLAGLLSTVIAPIGTIASMGLCTSGVRQIAEAYGRNDENRIGLVVGVLRYTVWATGLLALVMTVVLSPVLSQITFQSGEYTTSIALLGITILIANIAVGQSCILKGTRRIVEIAKISIWGALNGMLISIPCYYIWGIKGIVPGMVLYAVANLVVSWHYARRVHFCSSKISWDSAKHEIRQLLSFGLPIMLSGVLSAILAYGMRLIILKQHDLAGVGVWGAAFNISGILVNFVLNAMGTDYYPRLTGVSHDNQLISREVNAQTELAILLAVPALVLTILFAPWAIKLLYSGLFDEAIPVLRWSVYGIFGRVLSWPLGYIMLAKKRGMLFFCSEFLMGIVHLALIYLCGQYWGLKGTGIAFMLMYMIYICIMIFVSQWISQTHWSMNNIRLIVFSVCALSLSGLFNVFFKNGVMYYCASTLFAGTIAFFMIQRLSRLTGITFNSLLNKGLAR